MVAGEELGRCGGEEPHVWVVAEFGQLAVLGVGQHVGNRPRCLAEQRSALSAGEHERRDGYARQSPGRSGPPRMNSPITAQSCGVEFAVASSFDQLGRARMSATNMRGMPMPLVM